VGFVFIANNTLYIYHIYNMVFVDIGFKYAIGYIGWSIYIYIYHGVEG